VSRAGGRGTVAAAVRVLWTCTKTSSIFVIIRYISLAAYDYSVLVLQYSVMYSVKGVSDIGYVRKTSDYTVRNIKIHHETIKK
jgi:hypothetical protein